MPPLSPLMNFLRSLSPGTSAVVSHSGYSCKMQEKGRSCSFAVEVSRFNRFQSDSGLIFATRHIGDNLVGLVCWDTREGALIEDWTEGEYE